jgi:hypothetical protein
MAKAAKVRRRRAVLRRQLKAGEIGIAEVLLIAGSGDRVASRMLAIDLVSALPGVTRSAAARLLISLGIPATKRVGGLSAEECRAIAESAGRGR